jgi:DNA-binding MarR family transcriptional regulator
MAPGQQELTRGQGSQWELSETVGGGRWFLSCSKADMDDDREELFRLLFGCAHQVTLCLRHIEQFDEWSAMEILALRAFERSFNQATCTTAISRRLYSSVPYASKLLRRLREKGLIRPGTFYRGSRGMVLTDAGSERIEQDDSCLESFVGIVFQGLSEEQCLQLRKLLLHVMGNVPTPRRRCLQH